MKKTILSIGMAFILSASTLLCASATDYKAADDGYLFAFATRLDKQGQNYGKPLMKALLHYLDATGQGCYLETLKPENVGMYEHFSFRLKEEIVMESGNLTLFAMHRPKGG